MLTICKDLILSEILWSSQEMGISNHVAKQNNQSTALLLSFEWSHTRVTFTDSKGRVTLRDIIT